MDLIIKNMKTSFIKISKYIANKPDIDQLDLEFYCSKIIINELLSNKSVRGYVTKYDTIKYINPNSNYLLSFNSIDEPYNYLIDYILGSIFCIFEYNKGDIKNGNNIVCSGYCLYSNSIQLIIATNKVDKYILKNEKFYKIDENMMCKLDTDTILFNIDTINNVIDHRIKDILKYLVLEHNYSIQWKTSLILNFHIYLLNGGGFFAIPGTTTNLNGKLSLICQAYPLAYMIYIYGGYSTNGLIPVLDIDFPKNKYNMKTPLIIANKYELYIYNKEYDDSNVLHQIKFFNGEN